MSKNHLHISLIACLVLLVGAPAAVAQVNEPDEEYTATIPGQRFRVYEYNGETYMYGSIDGVEISRRYPTEREMRQGRRTLERFTRLQWYVHSVYPYAQGVADLMSEVEQDLQHIQGKQAREDYIKMRETALFEQYEDDLRKMSRTQGKLLVKLIDRQAGVSAYELIKETKSGATAFFWNGIGRLFGINLKDDFDSEEDAWIEAIVRDLDRGGYNIAYKAYDYRLPE